MRKVSVFLLFIVLFTSCLSKKDAIRTGQRYPAPGQQTYPGPSKGKPGKQSSQTLTRSSTAEAYIERFKDIAIAEMNTYGIPASIKLAQALLESGNGNSTLARNSNNHFGIKCTSNWQGRTVLKDDDNPDDCFRVYNNPEESFRDHSEFLLRKRYAALFELDKNDYVGWARGLKKAGYATNPRYAELLISLIERYELYRFDRSESPREKNRREEAVFTELVAEIPQEARKEEAKPTVAMTIHKVQSGDTLYNIARKYNLSVEELKILNNLNGESILLGQLLLVSK